MAKKVSKLAVDAGRANLVKGRAKMTKKRPIKVEDTMTGEIYPSIESLRAKFGLRHTGINEQLHAGIHPRFKKL